MTYSPHQLAYFAHQLTRRAAPNSMDRMAGALLDAQVDLNPHQIDVALFATSNPTAIPLGRYELPRRSEEAHIYRMAHPLAQGLIDHAQRAPLSPSKLALDYDAYGAKVSMIEALRGQTGTLLVQHPRIQSPGATEEHLLAAAIDADGTVFDADVTDRLLSMPGHAVPLPRVDGPPFSSHFRTTSPQRSRTCSISPPPMCPMWSSRQRYNSRSTSTRHW